MPSSPSGSLIQGAGSLYMMGLIYYSIIYIEYIHSNYY